jgi:hypothetical protein
MESAQPSSSVGDAQPPIQLRDDGAVDCLENETKPLTDAAVPFSDVTWYTCRTGAEEDPIDSRLVLNAASVGQRSMQPFASVLTEDAR